MNYYIIDKKIIAYENELDYTLYSYPKLTDEQKAFYELHKCSLQEVLNLALNEPYIPLLADLKEQRIEFYSQLAFEKRAEMVPDYKLTNASLGIYSEQEVLRITNLVKAFRTEFYRLAELVNNCLTIEELNLIEDNYNAIQS